MILESKDLRDDVTEEADVCVVGSGAGGAYAALELARRGLSVTVLEEGGAYGGADFTGRVRDAFATLYRNGGLDFAIGRPAILVPTGKCLGGTTVVNMGVCFRAPDSVLAAWKGQGLDNYGPNEMGPVYDRVEERMSVQPVKPEVMGRNGELVIEGAERLGLHPKPIRRNVSDACKGCGNCAYGCREDAKQSMAVEVIPQASSVGARFLCDTRVEGIITENGRAAGVSGWVLDRVTGARLHRVGVRAKVVVVAAGALHTPTLLTASGIGGGSGALGRHLKLHLCARAVGVFDEPVDAFRGVCQSVYVDDFREEGIMLEATFTGPCSQLPGILGYGAEFWQKATSYGRMAGVGVLTSEEAEGRVFAGPGGRPLVVFQATRSDAENAHRGMMLANRVLFAAGARKVMNGSYVLPELSASDDLRSAYASPVRPQDLLMMAFHPQGTCRMGADPTDSVVGPSGECHQLANLYVADASIFPSSVGVNPQETIWALAHKVSESIARNVFGL